MSGSHHATPEEAEHAFYEAIAQSDADRLLLCWSDEDETVCVHPTGVRIEGNPAIGDSWRAIFASAKIRIEPELRNRWQSGVLAIHHLTEYLFVGDDPNPHGPLYVTHVFARGADGWHLICRHASAADDAHQAMADARPHTLH